jgi:hypothetical protein
MIHLDHALAGLLQLSYQWPCCDACIGGGLGKVISHRQPLSFDLQSTKFKNSWIALTNGIVGEGRTIPSRGRR